jgi:hypothetical protein
MIWYFMSDFLFGTTSDGIDNNAEVLKSLVVFTSFIENQDTIRDDALPSMADQNEMLKEFYDAFNKNKEGDILHKIADILMPELAKIPQSTVVVPADPDAKSFATK